MSQQSILGDRWIEEMAVPEYCLEEGILQVGREGRLWRWPGQVKGKHAAMRPVLEEVTNPRRAAYTCLVYWLQYTFSSLS